MIDAIDELIDYRKPHGISKMLNRVHRFHKAKPEVLDFLVQELRIVREIGWPKASVGSLWHHARWVLTQKHRAPGETFVMSNNLFPLYERIIVILHPEFNGFYEMIGCDADVDLGTAVEPAVKNQERGYIRRLLWADGKPIGSGWRPTIQHEPKRVARRERAQRKPPMSVGLTNCGVTASDFIGFKVTDRPAVCCSCGPVSGTNSPVLIEDKQFCVWCALDIAEALLSPGGKGRFEKSVEKFRKAQ